jgi:uncharacterized protein
MHDVPVWSGGKRVRLVHLTVMALLAVAWEAHAMPPPIDPVRQAAELEAQASALRPAAEAGDAGVQWQLAQLLRWGQPMEALAWTRKAAAQGHEEALMQLTDTLLADGTDKAALQEALDWLRRAAALGNVPAQVKLGNALGFPYAGIAANEAESVHWYRRAAEAGDPWSQLQLGQALRAGRGTAKDESEAVKWFGVAAHKGDGLAQFYLAEMLQQGKGTAKDEAAAVSWYLKAVKGHGGPQIAAYALGRCFEFGLGVRQDFLQAAHWYESGARANEGRSQRKLARFLQAGKGLARDPVQAYAWLSLALDGDTGHWFDKEEREELAAMLTPAQLAEGRRLAAQWRPGQAMGPSLLKLARTP